MFALISTIQPGKSFHFCEVAEETFPVAEPDFYWIDCPQNVSPTTHDYDGVDFIELQISPPVKGMSFNPVVSDPNSPTVI